MGNARLVLHLCCTVLIVARQARNRRVSLRVTAQHTQKMRGKKRPRHCPKFLCSVRRPRQIEGVRKAGRRKIGFLNARRHRVTYPSRDDSFGCPAAWQNVNRDPLFPDMAGGSCYPWGLPKHAFRDRGRGFDPIQVPSKLSCRLRSPKPRFILAQRLSCRPCEAI